MMKSPWMIILTAWVCFYCGYNLKGQAVIKEEQQAIKTYPFSDPNPVPTLAVNSKVSPFYPYFAFDGYTDTGISKEWKVITLENEYIIVTVLPGVGGKVWGAVEKSTGREFIYKNHVMKFRAIGIRGPWTSGGIEHNFGLDLGHAPWTASDVDYIMKVNPDSSVSCIVGGLDLPSRTQWRVNILLPKDKAMFETRSMWYNPTPLHNAYLSWEVAAYKADEDLEFYFPGTVHIGHDGAASQWPVDEMGHNLSVYKENNFGTSKSYHVFGMYPNWFGGYYHDTEFGSAHWSSYDDSPGKKLWIWSLARDGAIWEDLLTDSDGQYIEAQPGAYFNQPSAESGYNTPFNQLLMRPYYTETKSDFWFPVKETGGIVDATSNGTLNLKQYKDSLKISFCPNVKIQDSLIVMLGERVLFRKYIRLSPLQVYQETIPYTGSYFLPVRVNIGNGLLSYTSDKKENEISRPFKTPSGQDFNSVEHLYRMAEDVLSMRNYSEALEIFLACIAKEPTHSRALTRAAELYYRKGQFEEGLNYARRVLENNTYDGGANFIYGIIQKAIGNYTMAEEAFSVAVRTMEFRSAAYVEIAGLRLRKKDFINAVTYSGKALDYNRFNIAAYQVLATAYRILNRHNEALRTADMLLEIDPLNHYAAFEQYLLRPSEESLSNFTSSIKNELPHETYLELALEYAANGHNKEAIKILEKSPEYPTVYYWLAYLSFSESAEKSRQYLNRAIAMSPLMVFPFRLETIPVLRWAQEQQPSWKNNYYLALVFWNIRQTVKAKELFAQCGNIPDFAYFYISRGILFQDEPAEIKNAGSDFLKAKSLAPKEWRTWHYLNLHLRKTGNLKGELENSQQAFTLFPGNPAIGLDFAMALLLNGKFNESLKILKNIKVLPFEGARDGYQVFEMVNLSLALNCMEKKKYGKAIEYLDQSKEYPENLGAGKPYEPDTRLQDFIAAYCEIQLGNPESASNYYQHIIDYSEMHWHNTEDPVNLYIAARVFEAQGKKQEADLAIKKWKIEQDSLRDWRISAGSSSPINKWFLSDYYNEEEKARKSEAELLTKSGNNKFGILMRAVKLSEK